MTAGNRVDEAEEVRIQRRLIEDVVAEPVAGRDPARPFVVAVRVAHQQREVRRPAHLKHVHQPDAQRDGKDRERVPASSFDSGTRQCGPSDRVFSFSPGQDWYASARWSSEKTGEVATNAERIFLRDLRELCGVFLSRRYGPRRSWRSRRSRRTLGRSSGTGAARATGRVRLVPSA